MELYDIIFYFFAAMILVSGFVVVGSKNIVYSAYSLLFVLIGIAAFYILLGADFLGVVQLMVYVGGILILLLFGIMLTNKVKGVEIKSDSNFVIPSLITIAVFTAFLLFIITETNWQETTPEFVQTTVKSLGIELIQNYSLVFEILAVVLLIALIGAATLARNDNKEN
jgi:NADH-quinone oxidoreductase subunit J